MSETSFEMIEKGQIDNYTSETVCPYMVVYWQTSTHEEP